MTLSFARHQFPPAVIRHAVRLYMRFTLNYRDVEDLLAERGLDISYETVRRWVLKFDPLFARELRRRRPRPTLRWHLDEVAVTIVGRQFWHGIRLTMKARFSTCSCNDSATKLRQ
jgi:putative transposase